MTRHVKGRNILARLGLRAEHESWMLLSGLLAMCVLFVIAVIVLPLFGPRIAGLTAIVLVAGILAVCYLLCVSHPPGGSA